MATKLLARASERLAYRAVCGKIMERIAREKLWGRHLPPERELARLFRVSRDTVRRGLELLERRGLISRVQGQGTRVLPRTRRRKASATTRVAVGSYQSGQPSGYVGEIMAGLVGGATQAGWLFSFNNLAVPTVRQAFFEELKGGDISGVLLLSFTDRSLVKEMLQVWSGPLVLVDHHFEDLPITSVMDDSEGGARQAVEHLLSLGHRRVGYVEIARRELNPWRYTGYAGALRDAGIEPDEELVEPCYGSFDAGRVAGEKLLGVADPPTAIFAFDDLRAWGVWRAAEAHGLEVGKDLALVGFGDRAAQAGFPEELSSVRFSSRRIGEIAVEKLDELMEGGARPGELALVPAELVIRNSSRDACPAARERGEK